jgi:hypothetical protein
LILSEANVPMEISTIPGLTSQPETSYGNDLSPLLAQIYDTAAKYFQSPAFFNLFGTVKAVLMVLSVIFAVILVIIIIKMGNLIEEEIAELKAELNPPREAVSPYDNRWQEIKNQVNSVKESEWKMAVIEADKLVDDVLKSAGFAGESMGERLMLIKPDQLLNLQYLWDAHKLRNLLVHDVSYQMTHRQAIWAIEAFESVLRELEALS